MSWSGWTLGAAVYAGYAALWETARRVRLRLRWAALALEGTAKTPPPARSRAAGA